jgi:hypothetical protein
MININDIVIGEYYNSIHISIESELNFYESISDEFIKIEYLSKDYILCSYNYGELDPFPIWSDNSNLVLNIYSVRKLTEHEIKQIKG